MVKISSNDALAVLRRFNMASDENTPRNIEQLNVTNPSPINTLATFRFLKQQYYVLFDDTAEDDTAYVTEQISMDGSLPKGALIENPNDHMTTYALPFKGKDVYLYKAISDKVRLDLELSKRYADKSRSTWQKHIKAGHISVNDKTVTSPKHDVTANDAIAINLPPEADYSDQSLPIVYIDDNVVVVHKPAGALTHSKGAINEEFTVADFFRRYTTWGLDTNRPGIIHRLDRDTSGLIIGARNADTADSLKKQFAQRTVKKKYVAVVTGRPKVAAAEIDIPIIRNQAAPSTFKTDPQGKPAQTRYEVIAYNETESLVVLNPKTGRTHQLRVHMRHIGTPIVGDRVYGKASDRMYLHAYSLEITLPGGKRTTFTAAPPAEFLNKFAEVSEL